MYAYAFNCMYQVKRSYLRSYLQGATPARESIEFRVRCSPTLTYPLASYRISAGQFHLSAVETFELA